MFNWPPWGTGRAHDFHFLLFHLKRDGKAVFSKCNSTVRDPVASTWLFNVALQRGSATWLFNIRFHNRRIRNLQGHTIRSSGTVRYANTFSRNNQRMHGERHSNSAQEFCTGILHHPSNEVTNVENTCTHFLCGDHALQYNC